MALPHDRVYSLNNFIVVNYSSKIEISSNNKIHILALVGKFFLFIIPTSFKLNVWVAFILGGITECKDSK